MKSTHSRVCRKTEKNNNNNIIIIKQFKIQKLKIKGGI